MIHILVVDDDKNLNQTVCTYLNDCGFEAKGVLSANEAYDEMYNNLYELIISDIMMPEIDGFEFAETVRQVNKQIPILFMSAKDDLPSKRKGFLVGRWKSWISRYGILRRTDLTFPSAVYLLVGFFWLYMVISLQKMDYYGRKDIPEARNFRPDGMCERYLCNIR